jgi:uncharacterized membrane protein YqjE
VETLARLGVATIELFEAEGRSLRRNLVRLAIAAGCGLMLLALALVGLGFLAVGTFWLLEQSMPPYYAAMLMGTVTLLLAAAGVAAIREML